MKIIIPLISSLFLIFLCGCSISGDNFTPPDYPIIDAPDKFQSETVDGYFSEKQDETNNKDILYYANKKTHKFHLAKCTYAKNLSDVNARLEKDRDTLLSDGYSPCGICKP